MRQLEIINQEIKQLKEKSNTTIKLFGTITSLNKNIF